MAKLRFYSRDGLLVSFPNARNIVGQPMRYIGRELREIVHDGAKRFAYVATAEPFEVDESTECARRLVKLTRRDSSLWPADEHTARACGVQLVKVAQDHDGEWIAADRKEID